MNLQLVSLSGMRLEDDILENLGKLPKSLTTAYEQTFKTMREEATDREWDLAMKALMWIMCSRELLSNELWTEMTYWPKSVPLDGGQFLFELCRNLVAWDRQSKLVKFAHLSVNEYLDTIFGPTQTNTMAARNCLSVFDPTLTPPEAQFLAYSTRYWPDHMERCYSPKQQINEDLLNQLHSFLGTSSTPGPGYIGWYQEESAIWEPTGRRPRMLNPKGVLQTTPPNPLFAMCYFSFGVILHVLWESDFDVNSCNNRGETLLFVASGRGNEWAVERLLEKGANINTGSCDPLLAAIDAGDESVALRLLCCGVGRDTCDPMLATAARQGTLRLLEAFLHSYPDTTLTQSFLMAMTENYTWGVDMMEMLIARGFRIPITEAVLTAALRRKAGRDRLLRMMLSVDQEVRIVASELPLLVETSYIDLIKLVFARDPDIKITEAILRSAASNWKCGNLLIPMLLTMEPDIQISGAVIVAAAANDRWDKEMLEVLVAKDRNSEISAVILGSDLWSGRNLLNVVLARHPTVRSMEAVPTEKEMVIDYCLTMILRLLTGYPNLKIGEVTVLAAVGNTLFSLDVLRILLATDPNIMITQQIMIEAAKNEEFGSNIIPILLARNADLIITEQIVVAATQNWRCGLEIIGILLIRKPDIMITEQIMIAAARNKEFASQMIGIFLARYPDLIFTEQIVVAATQNRGCGLETIAILLTRYPDLIITEHIVVEAAKNDQFGCQIIAMLHTRNPAMMITERIMVEAAKNEPCGMEILTRLLIGNPDIEITEQMILAASRNRWYTDDILLLLRTQGTITETQEAAARAAGWWPWYSIDGRA